MKTIKFFLIGILLLLFYSSKAQLDVSINLGTPPMWGPVGYDNVQYYYLPDIESYYEIQSGMFIYLDNGIWIRSAFLPFQYQDYDLYNGYKVVLTNYHGNRPYYYFKHDHRRYYKGYRGRPQHNYGHRPDNYQHNRPIDNGNHSGNNKPTNNGNHRSDNNNNSNHRPATVPTNNQNSPNNQSTVHRPMGNDKNVSKPNSTKNQNNNKATTKPNNNVKSKTYPSQNKSSQPNRSGNQNNQGNQNKKGKR